jgi:hypothetical protein
MVSQILDDGCVGEGHPAERLLENRLREVLVGAVQSDAGTYNIEGELSAAHLAEGLALASNDPPPYILDVWGHGSIIASGVARRMPLTVPALGRDDSAAEPSVPRQRTVYIGTAEGRSAARRFAIRPTPPSSSGPGSAIISASFLAQVTHTVRCWKGLANSRHSASMKQRAASIGAPSSPGAFRTACHERQEPCGRPGAQPARRQNGAPERPSGSKRCVEGHRRPD